MPPATEAGQSQAAPAVSPEQPLFSPAGIIVLLVVMLLEGVAVFFVAMIFQPGIESLVAPDIKERYSQVNLDQYHRQFQDLDATNFVVEHFRLRVALVLNPKYGDLENLREMVEDRRSFLQDRAWSVIDGKTELELRQRAILDSLRLEIKRAVNEALPATEDGQEIVYEVIFPERSLLQHKK